MNSCLFEIDLSCLDGRSTCPSAGSKPRYTLRGGHEKDEDEEDGRHSHVRRSHHHHRRQSRHLLPRRAPRPSASPVPGILSDHIHQSRNIVVSSLSALYTFVAFVFACFLAPWLIAIYFVVRGCRKVWMSVLEWRFRDLELIKWTTPRTAVDTRRNQGIITVLLKVNGEANRETIETMKNRIQADIVDKRKADGSLAYPHLKCVLSSGWGRYGWVKGSEGSFNIDNHVTLGNPFYKGRPITEANIQDYISDVISKMMIPELPPWQVSVVPTTSADERPTSYLLIRVHHLYLSEDGLALGDLLMMEQHPSPPTHRDTDQVPTVQNILAGIFTPPVVIPQVLQHLGESMSNYWNELVSQYDPLQNPELLKTRRRPYLTDFVVLSFITVATALKNYKQRNYKEDFLRILKLEREKRNLDVRFFGSCMYNSLNVINLCILCVKFWLLVFTGPIRVLIHLIRETPVYFYWLYLGHYFVQECLYILSIVYTAPRVLLEEIFLPEYPNDVQELQTSVCGRNVVSWSEPVPVELIARIRQATGASTCEVLLSATAASLRDYLDKLGCGTPDAVMTTSRFMPQEQLFVGAAPSAGPTGMLCLPLPTATPRSKPLYSLRSLQRALDASRSKQAALYLASVYRLDYGLFTTILPSVFARACLYLLSRRYAISLTEIDSTSPSSLHGDTARRLTWGPQVEKIMYWRPPQANVCLSLTLMNYGGTVQLGVMAAAQLAPQHTYITKSFSANLFQLAKAAGVPTTVTVPAPLPVELPAPCPEQEAVET